MPRQNHWNINLCEARKLTRECFDQEINQSPGDRDYFNGMNKNYLAMHSSDENNMLFSPKAIQHHFTNGIGLSSRKSRSRELVSATAIIQKCIKIINLVSEVPSKNQHYLNLKEEPEPMAAISNFIDQIYDCVVRKGKGMGEEQGEMESLLQKQEQVNRGLIKKELEIREEHKNLYDELMECRAKGKQLNEMINKLNIEVEEQSLTINLLQRELKDEKKGRIMATKGSKMMDGGKEMKSVCKMRGDMENQKSGFVKLGHHRHSSDLSRKTSTTNPAKKSRKSSMSKR